MELADCDVGVVPRNSSASSFLITDVEVGGRP